jgi:acetoacetyl-CoA synthetase
MSVMGASTRVSPILQIKDGAQHPPVFICHGLSGTVQFWELVKHIHTAQPIYGIQARGIDGSEPPLSSVTEMADYYYDALQQLFPEESYVLVGYSFGGLVALEMAQRIIQSDKRVAQLVLIDSFPHPRFMPAAWRMRLFVRRMRVHGQRMGEMQSGKALQYFVSGLKRRLHLARPLNDNEGTPEMLALPRTEAALRRVNENAYRAYANYRPTFYPGPVKFVTTADKTFFPGDPAAIWGALVEKLEVEEIRGDHLNIVTSEFMPLASVLTRYLREVAREP